MDGELVGVYVGGSYALGAYEPVRSDIDVAAVISSQGSRALKECVAAAVRHESLPCPARGLELVVYRRDAVQRGTTEAGFELNLNTGSSMAFRADFEANRAEAHWFPIDRSVLRECGVALCGPPPAEVFGALPRRPLATVLVESIRWHATAGARADDAVLNACRAWRWAVDGVWSSKPAAGAWARSQPGAPPLIAESLAARHGNGQLDPPAVEIFLQDVVSAVEEVAAE
jgi:hypothetical protein